MLIGEMEAVDRSDGAVYMNALERQALENLVDYIERES